MVRSVVLLSKENPSPVMRCFRSSAPVVSLTDVKNDGLSDSSSVDEAIDLKGEQTASNSKAHLLELDYKDLWALALTTALGGHYLPWSHALSAGFGSFMIVTALIATAYICLIVCSAELSSALPFAGN
jgi:amino acid permease